MPGNTKLMHCGTLFNLSYYFMVLTFSVLHMVCLFLRITGESGDFWMAMSWNAETSSYIWSYNGQNVSDGFQNWQYGR